MSVNISKHKEVINDEFAKRLSLAIVKAMVNIAYESNDPVILESLRRLWKEGTLQKYVDRVPKLKVLIELGKLP